jgi:hypothetical protein
VHAIHDITLSGVNGTAAICDMSQWNSRKIANLESTPTQSSDWNPFMPYRAKPSNEQCDEGSLRAPTNVSISQRNIFRGGKTTFDLAKVVTGGEEVS